MPALFVLALACGDGKKTGPSDAGPDAGDAAARFEPTPPSPPVFGPCPTGWHAVVEPDDDVATCEPWPEGAPDPCADDAAHFPGGAACETIGTPCDAGDFAVGLPASGVWYVRAGAAAGGDGSIASPFARIADALDAAAPGDTVALSKGTFDEVVFVSRAVTIRGACVAETAIASSAASEAAATIQMRAAGALENLRVSGDRFGIDVLAAGARLSGVLVDGATSGGVTVTGSGRLVGTDLVVRDTRVRPSDGQLGDGLAVTGGGDAEITRGVFERNRSTAIWVDGAGSTLVATSVSLRSTGRTATEGLGYGVLVTEGGSAELSLSVVEDDRAAGLKAVGATLVAADVVVRDVQGFDDGRGGGYGIYASLGATVTLDRVWLARNWTSGLRAWDAATHVDARDLVVRDTSPHAEAGYLSGTSPDRGYGLDLFSEASATIERAAFTRDAVVGIRVLEGATLGATDVAVVRTAPDRAGDFGVGLAAFSGASVVLTRASLGSNLLASVVALDGAHIDASDLAVVGTTPSPCCLDQPGGTGLFARDEGAIVATRLRVSDNAFCGVQIAPAGSMDLEIGEVSENSVGANVQVEGYDVGRIQAGVAYRDNDQTLDTTALPVPATLTDLGE